MEVKTPREFEVELASGRYFDVTNPDWTVLELDDIATALSKECRYGGACKGFYSVAEHAVLVSDKLRRLGAPLRLQFAGLHHDDPEWCLKDLQRPVKLALRSMQGAAAYADLTERLEEAIWLAFGTARTDDIFMPAVALWVPGDEHHDLVKRVDNWACQFEASQIMPSRGRNWGNVWLNEGGVVPIEVEDEDRIWCHEWPLARNAYLDLHHRLVLEAVEGVEVGA